VVNFNRGVVSNRPSCIVKPPNEVDVFPGSQVIVEPANRSDSFYSADQCGCGHITYPRTGSHYGGPPTEIKSAVIVLVITNDPPLGPTPYPRCNCDNLRIVKM
jgi:hypothetical protein